MRNFFLICLFLVFVGVPNFYGQTKEADNATCSEGACCCGNDPTPAGVMISHVHAKNEWMISYRYMGMNMSGVEDGLTNVSQSDVLASYMSSPDLMKMQMHMGMLMCGITDRLTVMGMFNYVSNYMEMTMPVGSHLHHHSMSAAGIGDSKLYALYALKKNMFRQIIASLGINLPTGSISIKGPDGAMMYPNQRYAYSMQLGSGTVDLLPGFTYLKQNGKWTNSAQVQATIRTGKNSLGYRLGHEVLLNAWTAYYWLPFMSSSLRLEANYTSALAGSDPSVSKQIEISANPANYGGTRANLFLGTSFQTKKGFLKKNRLSVEYGLPVYQNIVGLQMKSKSSLYISWTLMF